MRICVIIYRITIAASSQIMLTLKGLPVPRKSNKKIAKAKIHAFDSEGIEYYSFIHAEIETCKGICCKERYLVIYCTLCDLCVNISIQGINHIDTNDLIISLHESHSHKNVMEKLIYVGSSFEKNEKHDGGGSESYIGFGNTRCENAIGKDICCGICGKKYCKNFVDDILPLYMSREVRFLNTHYKKGCAISKIGPAKEGLALNRSEESQTIYKIAKEFISNIKTEFSGIIEEYEYNLAGLVKIQSDCTCGKKKILKCAVCHAEWKDYDISFGHYINIVKHHFGKTHIMGNFADLIYPSAEAKLPAAQSTSPWMKKYQQYCCVICGMEYEHTDFNGVNGEYFLPAKEIVLDHFKLCLEANSHNFANNWYKCVQ